MGLGIGKIARGIVRTITGKKQITKIPTGELKLKELPAKVAKPMPQYEAKALKDMFTPKCDKPSIDLSAIKKMPAKEYQPLTPYERTAKTELIALDPLPKFSKKV